MGLDGMLFPRVDDANGLDTVLEAIDRLLDAMERLDAPITRDLLRTAMVALVEECGLQDPATLSPH